MKTFVVIPAYNEEERIGKVLEGVKKYVPQDKIIVVDDGSKDNTFNIARESGVVVLKHKINLGKGAALKTSCKLAITLGADVIVMMDGDGQHDPKYLPQVVETLGKNQVDVVFASRKLGLDAPLVRFLGNKFNSILINLLFGIYVSDPTSGFRGFTPYAYRKIFWESSRYGVETEMVVNTGKGHLKFLEIPIETLYKDKYKGVTILDAAGIFFNLLKWRFK